MARLPEQKSPLIIVQGGGYRTMITDSCIYKEETKKAANEGYTMLKVCGWEGRWGGGGVGGDPDRHLIKPKYIGWIRPGV